MLPFLTVSGITKRPLTVIPACLDTSATPSTIVARSTCPLGAVKLKVCASAPQSPPIMGTSQHIPTHNNRMHQRRLSARKQRQEPSAQNRQRMSSARKTSFFIVNSHLNCKDTTISPHHKPLAPKPAYNPHILNILYTIYFLFTFCVISIYFLNKKKNAMQKEPKLK
jgi:hypothetical protein